MAARAKKRSGVTRRPVAARKPAAKPARRGARTKSGTSYSIAPAQWFIDWVRDGDEVSGVTVNTKTALGLSAVWACVRVRSEDMAKLPCLLYKRTKGGGKERADNHPAYRLIKDRPNPRQTAFQFKQFMQMCLDLHGNAYAFKEFDARGNLIALWPLRADNVTVLITSDGKDLFYDLSKSTATYGGEKFGEPIPSEYVLHIAGDSLDGITGMSPISYHKETIGLAIAAERYGAKFFENAAQPKGGIKMPGTLGKPAADALRASWEERHKGVKNAHKLAIFDGGMEWFDIGMKNTDAEYILTRKLQNSDIWRIYRMPPHKVGDLERSTNNNIEHQGLEYVTDCLMSEMVRWEQTLARDLLSEKEQAKYFFEFMPDALLRGDIKARYEAYALARSWGWMSANDVLDRENMNRIGPKGDIYLQPMNFVEAGTPPPLASPGGAKYLLQFAQALVAREEQSNV